MNIKWILSALFALFGGYAAANDLDCKSYKGTLKATVVKVADGDTATVRLKPSGDIVKVRFYGVDTPESKWRGHWPEQAFSSNAKRFTVKPWQIKTLTSDLQENAHIAAVSAKYTLMDGRIH